MYWQETDDKNSFVVPDDIIDVVYRIDCKRLPLDHAWALSQAIIKELPWLNDETGAGIHLIHVAESGNGWWRPDDKQTQVLEVSKRTRFTLRIPKQRLSDAQSLCNKTLDIDGHKLVIGEAQVKSLSSLSTLFARYVVATLDETEDQFMQQQAQALNELKIDIKKLLCGRSAEFNTPSGTVYTRSLMLADLSVRDAVKLQQQGIGPMRTLGCGLFIPHKGVAPVQSDD